MVCQDEENGPGLLQAYTVQVMTNIGYPASDLFHLFHGLHDKHSADRTKTTLVVFSIIYMQAFNTFNYIICIQELIRLNFLVNGLTGSAGRIF